MKNLKNFDAFVNESLKTYDMDNAKKVLLAEFERLGITDVYINTDLDMFRYFNKMAHDLRREETDYQVDKMINITFGNKTGDVKNALDNIAKVQLAFEKVGWFPAKIRLESGEFRPPAGPRGGGSAPKQAEYKSFAHIKQYPNDLKLITVTLDPTYEDLYKGDSRTFWHVTKKENLASIMKKGLLPKTHMKRTYYPQRIHLATKKSNAEFILPELINEEPGEYVMLEVTVPDNVPIYNDTRFNRAGVYVLNPIAPSNIKQVEMAERKAA